jgi:hypothetical protein
MILPCIFSVFISWPMFLWIQNGKQIVIFTSQILVKDFKNSKRIIQFPSGKKLESTWVYERIQEDISGPFNLDGLNVMQSACHAPLVP